VYHVADDMRLRGICRESVAIEAVFVQISRGDSDSVALDTTVRSTPLVQLY
jgi:hypothetical protein